MMTTHAPVRSPVSMVNRSFACVLALFVTLAALPVTAPIAQDIGDAAQVLAPWGQAPLAFVPNQGRANPAV